MRYFQECHKAQFPLLFPLNFHSFHFHSGPLLFNIFLNDLFLFATNSYLSNYVDDNLLYGSRQKSEEKNRFYIVILKMLQNGFSENYMVLNQGKCHFMSLGKNTENQTFVNKNKIKKTNEE